MGSGGVWVYVYWSGVCIEVGGGGLCGLSLGLTCPACARYNKLEYMM